VETTKPTHAISLLRNCESYICRPATIRATAFEVASLLNFWCCFHSFSQISSSSGNALSQINDVTLRRARLVLGWVTVHAVRSQAN